ncbi:hypothetical protein EDD70_2984 [Hydrogenoanaerobacterium saccharovorans]|uniref:Uncharacterized protein n=1 Tax=Hydrogenoanaerobacterium saccharovorans TaxID=474960 RepID=A0A1H7YKZ0_9FIRM|nr:hypothetical protein [Hydrogenoanaerobacterium saccharovorans]RPF41924.1 hypothetical protein EDD70_2984 [Hydrogenoanaerobacterium saccharovorans]SEM45957.1 hypothetical protein SAMN05216180_0067 [Hydrogenoanaerobacterium saccharovorans]
MADSGGVLVGGVWHEGDKIGYKTHDGIWHEIDNGFYKGFDGVWRECYSSGIPLNTLPIGSYINVVEPVAGIRRYIVLKHNYENTGRTLILRERLCQRKEKYSIIGGGYQNSELAKRLAVGGSTYNELFARSNIEPYLQTINVPIVHSSTILPPYSAVAFVLSETEYGGPQKTGEGSPIANFISSDSRRVLDNEGKYREWHHTRTEFSSFGGSVTAITDNGNFQNVGKEDSSYCRPATTLPSTLNLNPLINSNEAYDIL